MPQIHLVVNFDFVNDKFHCGQIKNYLHRKISGKSQGIWLSEMSGNHERGLNTSALDSKTVAPVDIILYVYGVKMAKRLMLECFVMFTGFASGVLQQGPRPRNGNKSDKAHPPIHPTKYTNGLQVCVSSICAS